MPIKGTFELPQRFFEKLSFNPDDPESCVLWTGSLTRDGYGQFNWRGKTWPSHRIRWTSERGVIPKNKILCHKCDTPNCVRLDHIFLGTYKENSQDMSSKGRTAVQKNPDLYKGTGNPHAKLNEDKVREIRKLHKEGLSKHEIADRFNISTSLVYLVYSRRTWGHVTDE